jgi:hypothetical protein
LKKRKSNLLFVLVRNSGHWSNYSRADPIPSM